MKFVRMREVPGAAELQQKIVETLRGYSDLTMVPENALQAVLDGDATEEQRRAAASAVYADFYYKCAKDIDVTQVEREQIGRLAMLLQLDDDTTTSVEYRVGLAIYRKQFRDAVADGELTQDEQGQLDAIREYFALHKRDVKRAISKQALAFYSFLLADALRDEVMTDEEMARLAAVARHFGLTSKQLQSISVPNQKEILKTALASIKSQGEIRSRDREYIQRLVEFLNAGKDLLKACMKDLDLYEQIFAIRSGELPVQESHGLILDQAEKLHYTIPVSYESISGGRRKTQGGTLYVGSFKLRFIGLKRSIEMRYRNLLQVSFELQKRPKMTVTAASGPGGVFRLQETRDPGALIELQEAIQFLVRKAKGLIVDRQRDTRHIPADIRSEVWYRDGGRCVMCGATEYLEFDHVIPRSKGGATSADNLQILCRKCNSEKSDSI